MDGPRQLNVPQIRNGSWSYSTVPAGPRLPRARETGMPVCPGSMSVDPDPKVIDFGGKLRVTAEYVLAHVVSLLCMQYL